MAGGRWGGDVDSSTAMLKSINAPIMHPLMLSRYTQKQWNESRHGLGQSEAMVMLMLPEMDGCLAEIPIAAMTEPAQTRPRESSHRYSCQSQSKLKDLHDEFVAN